MAIFKTLREANEARNIEWTGNQSIEDHTWRGCELGGEIGEAVEEIVTLHNGAVTSAGLFRLGSELADGVICIDLARMTLGLPPLPIVSLGTIGLRGVEHEAFLLARGVLRLQNLLKKTERERRGWPGSRADMYEVDAILQGLNGKLGLFASYYRVDLAKAVAATFNATSEKVGLVTRLALE